jgi:hypothetical protein
MWFRPPESNTLRPRRESCIIVCVALFKAELNLVSLIVHLTFYSSMTRWLHCDLGWWDPSTVGHYCLEVANDVFNGVGTSSLVVLPHRTWSTAWHRPVGLPYEWSTRLALHCRYIVATCSHVLQAWTALPARTSCKIMMALMSCVLETCEHALGAGRPCRIGRHARPFLMLVAHGPQGTARHVAAQSPLNRGQDPEP